MRIELSGVCFSGTLRGMIQQVNLGMIGGGTVGSGVFNALQRNAELLSARIGVRVAIRKIAVKAAKWSIWTIAALLMSSTFVAYFASWDRLVRGLTTDPVGWSPAVFVIALSRA